MYNKIFSVIGVFSILFGCLYIMAIFFTGEFELNRMGFIARLVLCSGVLISLCASIAIVDIHGDKK